MCFSFYQRQKHIKSTTHQCTISHEETQFTLSLTLLLCYAFVLRLSIERDSIEGSINEKGTTTKKRMYKVNGLEGFSIYYLATMVSVYGVDVIELTVNTRSSTLYNVRNHEKYLKRLAFTCFQNAQ